MTRRELLQSMSSREITEWMAYYKIEPFGEKRADLRAAIIASTIMNGIQSFGKGKHKYKPKDFMPDFEEQVATVEDTIKIIERLNKAFGGEDLRGK